MNKLKISSLAVFMGLTSGCMSTAPQVPMSEEEKAQIIAMQKAALGNFMGVMSGQQVTAQPQVKQQVAPEVFITEKELLAKKNEINLTGAPALFSRKKDGILINGQMYNDFEGSVANFGGNRLTGEFTYAVKKFNGSFILKYHKAGSTSAPVKIATVIKQGNSFNVKTVTGKELPGSSVTPTSDGFVVGRAGSAFKYTIGSDHLPSITVLDGYHIANHQNGDVASTGYLLLEKNERSKSDSVGGFMDSMSSLGNTFGLNKADHYVLVNIANGATVPLDVSLDGKKVASYSGCQKGNIVNKCDSIDFQSALYEKSGLKNNNHYFWSIDWIDTETGPLAFYKTSTKVKVVDINKGKVHTLFSRTLGVNEFSLIEHLDGKVSVKAKLGFSSEKIDDVESFMKTDKQEIEAMQTLNAED